MSRPVLSRSMNDSLAHIAALCMSFFIVLLRGKYRWLLRLGCFFPPKKLSLTYIFKVIPDICRFISSTLRTPSSHNRKRWNKTGRQRPDIFSPLTINFLKVWASMVCLAPIWTSIALKPFYVLSYQKPRKLVVISCTSISKINRQFFWWDKITHSELDPTANEKIMDQLLFGPFAPT